MNIEAARLKIIKTVAEIQNEFLLKQLMIFIAQFKERIPHQAGPQNDLWIAATASVTDKY